MSADKSEDIEMCGKEIILKHGDAFKLIKEVEDKSVDLICTDPPYDIPDDTARRVGVKPLTYKQKMEIVSEYKRVLKDTGSIVTFTGYNDMTVWIELLKKQGFHYRRPLVWVYRNPSGIPSKDNFYSAFEMILYFTKTSRYYYKPDKIVLNWFEATAAGGTHREKPDEYLWDSKLGTTPKPLSVVRTLVEMLCPEGGLVLDPFMGTGTTAVACKQLGVKFIGFEIKKHIYEYAVERVNKVQWKKVIDEYQDMNNNKYEYKVIKERKKIKTLADYIE